MNKHFKFKIETRQGHDTALLLCACGNCNNPEVEFSRLANFVRRDAPDLFEKWKGLLKEIHARMLEVHLGAQVNGTTEYNLNSRKN